MSTQMRNGTGLILSLSDDLLCGGLIPDCRVLLMARTCKRMQETLKRGCCAVDIRIKRKVSKDSRLARLVAPGINNLQLHFRIRHFECYVPMRPFQLRFHDFEELTCMHLRVLKMDANYLTELHLFSVLYMFTFSMDMRTFEFTHQCLKSRHVPWLAHCIHRFQRLETLNLDKNYFVFDSLALVLDAIQTTSLSTLNLSTNSCEDEFKTLKLCRVIEMNFNTLRSLTLSFMRLCTSDKRSFHSMVKAISTCRLLERVDLSHNHLHYGCLIDVLNATAGCHLESLNWSGNRLGSAGTFALGNHIRRSEILKKSLREVKLSMCDVYNGLQFLSEALTMCKNLHALDVSSNAVYAHEVVELLSCISSLNINNNYISDYGMQLVLQRATQSSTLKELHILGNHMSRHTVRRFRKMIKNTQISVHMPRAACVCTICSIVI